jgi:hypothetical protein
MTHRAFTGVVSKIFGLPLVEGVNSLEAVWLHSMPDNKKGQHGNLGTRSHLGPWKRYRT